MDRYSQPNGSIVQSGSRLQAYMALVYGSMP